MKLQMFSRIQSCLLLLLLPLLWIGGSSLRAKPLYHPFYIGVTEVNHNASEKSLEISCKVFVDDLEDILKKNNRTLVDLGNAAQQERNGVLVNQYFQQHLHFSVGGKAVVLRFVGFEKDAESAYAYFEAVGVPAIKKLDIDNSVLHDFTPEQINILHVTVGGRRQSTKLNFPARQASFSF